MINIRQALIIIIVTICIIVTRQGFTSEVEFFEVQCDKSSFWAAVSDSSESEYRKYAPDRKIDILHLILDVTPDFKARTIAGKTTLRFVPIAKPLRELRLEAIDHAVSSVESSFQITGYQVTAKEVIITFAEPIPPGVETTVTISYEVEQPESRLRFRTPEMGYREEDTHLWGYGSKYWHPSFDYTNEKFTSEVICHVPEDMVVLSNGKLISEEMNVMTGLKTVRWLQDKPHVNYLISLVAGKLEKIEDRYQEIPLAFYTPTTQIAQAKNSFGDTADMMAYFEQEIGIPYPWNKYYQVVVDDFSWGGLECTTLTILNDYTLFTEATENIRSSQRLVAHELAHQWFGDYVTYKDYSHTWLSEGFATYYAHLYDGYKNGRDSMLYGLYQDANRILQAKDASRPIVYKIGDPFDNIVYRKGCWVLHMLRSQLGEDLYRRCIKTYLEHHAFQSVVTEDLNQVLEEISGRSFDQFFDQWVYYSGYPKLEVSYSWNEADKLAKVTIKQTQELSDKVLLFNFPTKIRFKTKTRVIDREIVVKEKQHDFYFPLEEAPTMVRFDPDYGLLAKVKFDKPNAMLYAQLEDKEDVIGRLLAIEELKFKKDKKTIEQLKIALNNDPFHGVRLEASKALRQIHIKEAFEALMTSTQQPDARVRLQVVEDLGEFYREESLVKSKEILNNEGNPDILAAAIRNLGLYHDNEIQQPLLKFLQSQSYRNVLAEATRVAIHKLDDPTYIEPLKEVLAKREKEYISREFGFGLETLAYIARNEASKDDVREFLSGYVNHEKEQVQTSAIKALGTLRDPKAISLVETFIAVRNNDEIQRTAEEALKSLRDAKGIPVELKDLRSEVLELKKENEKIKQELEDLKKRLDAKEEKSSEKEEVQR